MTDQKQMNTVDSMLPIPQLFAFGLQHVLSMYEVPLLYLLLWHRP